MDVASIPILDVWRALGGGELRRGRGRAFWRGGDGWHVAIAPEKATWYDFSRGEGGGVLDLVERALGCDRTAAVAWLREFAGVPDQALAPAERRAWAERRRLTERHGEDAELWAAGLRIELEARKRRADEGDNLWGLITSARRLYRLEAAAADQILAWYLVARRRDWRECRRLVDVGRRDLVFSERLALLVVDFISEAAGRAAGKVA